MKRYEVTNNERKLICRKANLIKVTLKGRKSKQSYHKVRGINMQSESPYGRKYNKHAEVQAQAGEERPVDEVQKL